MTSPSALNRSSDTPQVLGTAICQPGLRTPGHGSLITVGNRQAAVPRTRILPEPRDSRLTGRPRLPVRGTSTACFVPVRELEPLAGDQGRQQDRARDVLEGEAAE